MSEPVKLTVSGILQDLKDGYTRTKDDKQYQGDEKSIQEKYGLRKKDVSKLFQHEKLKGKKTILEKVNAFILEDDLEEEISPKVTKKKVAKTIRETELVSDTKAEEIKTEEVVEEKEDEAEIPLDNSQTSKGIVENEDSLDDSWLDKDE